MSHRPDEDLQPGAARLCTATVSGQAGDWFTVRLVDGQEQRVLRAPSCLLEPRAGDAVLLCGSAPAERAASARVTALPCQWHVLAVLLRSEAGSGTLQLPGGARLQAEGGTLALQARELRLEGRERVHARTADLQVDAPRAELRLGRVQASAEALSAVLGELQLIGRKLHSRFDWLVQKARNSVRQVDELDDLRAGRTRWEIEGHAQMHARQATLLAEGAVKIDGARIDLG
jgi:hypothetical protein